MSLIAVPFQPEPEKLALVLERCCEHRPWFPDHIWNEPAARWAAARRYLAESYATGLALGSPCIWEVWRADTLCGILLLNQVAPHLEAQAHFIFFDHDLRGKRSLCRDLMQQAFQHFNLHVLRVEVPMYADRLSAFLRKALGFRYEAERRLPLEQAKAASRKHHATLYNGEWHDAVLLSVTHEEFTAFHERTQNHTTAGQPDGAQPLPDQPDSAIAARVLAEPAASVAESRAAASEPAPANGR